MSVLELPWIVYRWDIDHWIIVAMRGGKKYANVSSHVCDKATAEHIVKLHNNSLKGV